MKKKVTLKDIAKEIGVDPSTVSKALSRSSDISIEMQEKVKKYADKIGYRPNLLAKTLINKRSNILGVLIPDLRISFFSEAVRGIYEQASLLGYESILMVHDDKVENEKKKLEFLSDINVDGILLNSAGNKANHELYESLYEQGIKIVCWDRKINELNFDSVTIDDKQASFELTSIFINEGRKNIMFLGPNKGISIAEDRFEGYLDALRRNNIPIKKELILNTARTFESAYTELLNTLNNGTEIDGIVCLGGLVAYGAGNAILEKHLRIPDDIVLGEFGDNDKITRLGIPFYTVSQNPYEIGKESVKHLVGCIEGNKNCKSKNNIIVDYQIIARNVGVQYIPLI